MAGRTGKLYFNENEAARFLGITVEEFRALLKRHIVNRDEDVDKASVTTFHASDLLLLKLAAGSQIAIPPEGPKPEPVAVTTAAE